MTRDIDSASCLPDRIESKLLLSVDNLLEVLTEWVHTLCKVLWCRISNVVSIPEIAAKDKNSHSFIPQRRMTMPPRMDNLLLISSSHHFWLESLQLGIHANFCACTQDTTTSWIAGMLRQASNYRVERLSDCMKWPGRLYNLTGVNIVRHTSQDRGIWLQFRCHQQRWWDLRFEPWLSMLERKSARMPLHQQWLSNSLHLYLKVSCSFMLRLKSSMRSGLSSGLLTREHKRAYRHLPWKCAWHRQIHDTR